MDTAVEHDRADPGRGQPRWATRRSFLAMMAALIGPTASAQDDAEGRGKSKARLEVMRRLAKDLKIREIDNGKPGPPLPFRPEPLFRYSAPGRRVIDATLWGWGETGRPRAVMKVVLQEWARGQRHWAFGVSVLSSKRVEVEFGDGLRWSSRPPGPELRPVPDAPAPAASAAQRLAQAKDLARRFSAGAVAPIPPERMQFRLLTTPLHRYREPELGLLEGALFSFIYETHPAIALLLEAWTEGAAGASVWRYALVRLGANEQTVLLDRKPVWSVPYVTGPVDTELYMTRHMTRPMPADPADQD